MASLGAGAGLAAGFTSGFNTVDSYYYHQGLLDAENKRLQQNEQNQKLAQYMDLRSQAVQHMQDTIAALKNAHPQWTELQLSTNPAVVAQRDQLAGFDKNLGLPDSAASIVAGMVAGKSQIETEGALARAKEGPQHQALVASEIAKNNANAGLDVNNPDRPGTGANGPAMGGSRADTFNRRFAQSATADAPKVLSWGDARSALSEKYGSDKVMKAELFLKGNKDIISGLRGSGRNSERQQIQDIAMSLGRLVGMDPDQINQNFVDFAGKKAAATAGGRTAGTREANLGIILTAADSAIDAAITASNNVPRTDLVPLTRAQQLGQAAISNPELKIFQQKNLQLAELWAKSFNPTGVLRNEDRALALDVLNTALGQGTYEKAARAIRDSIGLEKKAAISFLKERGFSGDPQTKDDSSGSEPGPGGVRVHGFTFTPTGQ